MRQRLIGIGLIIFLGTFVHEALAQDRLPIIDMHLHDWGDGVEDELAVMDEFHIVKSFLSDSLETVYGWTAAAPGRFIPSPLFLASDGDDFPDIDNLRVEYAAGRLHGMGEINVQYLGIPPNAPSLEPYFALAEYLNTER